MSCYFENQLKGFNPIVAALQALGKDEVCGKCIGLKGAINKTTKLLEKKIRKEAEGSSLPDERKSMILTKIDELVDMLEGIGLASECSCQKTDGNCTIGSECFAKGIPSLIELVKEPATP